MKKKTAVVTFLLVLQVPLGEMISVDGNNMSVYKEGSGDKTLVFLSGGGTCSPILDFKSLYSFLSDEYQIVVVEKFGYGYSDVVDRDRDIDSILDDTRKSLEMAGIKGPYVLCPHSMSGLDILIRIIRFQEKKLCYDHTRRYIIDLFSQKNDSFF